MKFIKRLPLYLGLGIFVFSVIMSATKLGENKAITYNKSRASGSGTKLTLHFTEPNIISVMVTSEKQVAGIDAVIKYNKDMLSILPSTLIGGADFTSSGGTVDEEAGTFTFSSLAKPSFKNTGVVAMFEIRSKEGTANPTTEMTFDVTSEHTAVVEKTTGRNILEDTAGSKFTITAK